MDLEHQTVGFQTSGSGTELGAVLDCTCGGVAGDFSYLEFEADRNSAIAELREKLKEENYEPDNIFNKWMQPACSIESRQPESI